MRCWPRCAVVMKARPSAAGEARCRAARHQRAMSVLLAVCLIKVTTLTLSER